MFIKIGAEEHIRDLYENGTIFINTIEYFKKVGDKYEAASEIINSNSGTFRIQGIEKDLKYKNLHLKKAYKEVLGNIYSLYCISSKGFPNPLEFKVDEKNLRFGTHCLIIKDNLYFFEKVKSELIKKGYDFRHDFVDYYDKDKVSKELTLFDKPIEFEYQKEFRFYVHNQELEPIKIQIGSLIGKAEIREVKDLTGIKLELKKN